MTRLYTLPDGSKVPSVTSVLSVLAQPGLERWRLNIGATRAAQISREASDFGTLVHALCERIAKGLYGYQPNGDLDCPDDLRPFGELFVDWITKQHQVLATERTVAHPKLRYAGTLDLKVLLADGRSAIVDIKSGKRVSETTPLQIEAYRRADDIDSAMLADTRLVLHMPRDRPGHLEVIEYTDHERDWRGFLACLSLWWRFRGGEVT